MSEESDMWREYRERKKEEKTWHQKNTLPKEKELVRKLPGVAVISVIDDGSGGEKYVLDIKTERGARVVDWWTSTGLWKVRKGRGEGVGIYRLARYFQLIPKGVRFEEI